MAHKQANNDYYTQSVKQYEGTLGLIEDVARLPFDVITPATVRLAKRHAAEVCPTCNRKRRERETLSRSSSLTKHAKRGISPPAPAPAPAPSDLFCQCGTRRSTASRNGVVPKLDLTDSRSINARYSATDLLDANENDQHQVSVPSELSDPLYHKTASYRRSRHSTHSLSPARSEMIARYERRINALESELQELQELQRAGRMLSERYYVNGGSAESHEVLLNELRKRDETIARQRADLLSLQEAYDAVAGRLHAEPIDGGVNVKLEAENIAHRQTIRDQEQTIQHLRLALEQLESASRQSSGSLTLEIVERHDAYIRLRNQLRDAEERLAELNGSSLQRVDLVRQLKEELSRSNESLQTVQSRTAQLERDASSAQQRVAELAKENEHLRARLQDEELRVHQGRNELQSRISQLNEQLERERADFGSARDRFVRFERDATQTQTHLESKTRECVRLQQEVAALQRRLSERDAEFARLSDSENSLQQDLTRVRVRAEQTESEMATLKRQLKTSVDELQRSDVRVRELEVESRRDREAFNQDVAKREAEVHRLKVEITKLEDGALKPLEQRIVEQERALQARAAEKSTVQLELDTKSEKCRQLEALLSELKSRLNEEATEKNRLKTLTQDLEMELESARHNLDSKEAFVQQIREDNEAFEKQQKDLTYRLTHRNDLLQRLSTETAKIKAKFEEKLRETQQQNEALRNLQDALTATENAYEQLRAKHDDMLLAKDSAIKELQDVLTDLRSQSAKCVDQFAFAESQNIRLAEVNQQLTANVDETRAQLSSLDEAYHKLQLELSLVQEKLRTSQKEVVVRDQMILRLQADCDELHRRHETSMDEVSLKERELNRQQQRQRDLSNELRALHASIESYDKKLAELERFAREKDATIDLAKQEQAASNRALEQLRAELQREKQLRDEEVGRCKQQVAQMQRELEEAGLTIDDVRGDSAKHKQIVDSLQQELYKARQTAEQMANQSEKQSDVMKQHEMTIVEKRRELETLSAKKDEQIKQAETSALTFRQKYEQCMGHIEELKSTLELLQKQLLDSRQRDLEKQDQLDTVNRKLESRNAEFTRLQADHARYVELHRSANDEVVKTEQRVAELERELKRTKQQMDSTVGDLKQELTAVREQKTVLQSELTSITQRLEQTQSEASARDSRNKAELSKLEERTRRLETDLNERTAEATRIEAELTRRTSDLKRTEEERHTLEGDLSQRTRELDSARGELQERASQLRSNAQQSAQTEQRLAATEQQLAAANQEQAQRVQEIGRLEQANRKLTLELQAAREATDSTRRDLQEQKEIMEKLRRELNAVRDAEQSVKQQLQKCELELAASRDRERLLNEQAQQQALSIDQLQRELKSERSKAAEVSKLLQQTKQTVSDLEREIANRERLVKDLHSQLLERESEVEQLQSRLRQTQQQLSDTDGRLRTLQADYTTLEHNFASQSAEYEAAISGLQRQLASKSEECSRVSARLAECEASLGTLQRQLAAKSEECSRASAQLADCERQATDLRAQLQTLQIAHREALDTVQSLRVELQRSQQHSHALANQNASNEQKLNEVKQAYKSLESEYVQLRDQFSASSVQNQQLQSELSASDSKCKQLMQQCADREQELKLLRIDMNAIREKGEMKDSDIQTALRELDRLRQQVGSFEQLNNELRRKLADANQINVRLQEESEFVIRSVHKWVEEQKLANEKLSSKIRDQSRALVQLQDERDRLLDRVESLGDTTKRLRSMSSERPDAEKMRSQQYTDASIQKTRGILLTPVSVEESLARSRVSTTNTQSTSRMPMNAFAPDTAPKIAIDQHRIVRINDPDAALSVRRPDSGYPHSQSTSAY